jgi:antitoxin MazE
MTKKLTAIGNSLGIIIERPILELLNINRDTELEIRTDGEGLIMRPLRSHSQRVQEAGSRMMKVHKASLKKLAE